MRWVTLDKVRIVQHQTRVQHTQIGHHQHGGDVGMVVLERTHGDIELTDGNLFKDGAVKVVAVDNINVQTAGGRTGQFVGEMQFSLEDRDVGPVFQPPGHFGADGRCAHDDDPWVFREVRNFVAKGDEGGVELVQTDHRDCNSVTDFQHAVLVGNETSFAVTLLYTNDVGSPWTKSSRTSRNGRPTMLTADSPMSNSMM